MKNFASIKGVKVLSKKSLTEKNGGRPPHWKPCPTGYHRCEPHLCVRNNQGCP
ncbi:hypothetical protein [Aureibacter tunicatorum]|uniref:Uncharacterized protein n=1 Tax=Aureibacter tunicatorum TaxID=866807 RepID=A0AAE3XS71_9BACT|nr:hypothetical protein [Aureibacter tunicatorum]MDR6240514.1 hypothetical protein [Aureibacter tunicatorum]